MAKFKGIHIPILEELHLDFDEFMKFKSQIGCITMGSGDCKDNLGGRMIEYVTAGILEESFSPKKTTKSPDFAQAKDDLVCNLMRAGKKKISFTIYAIKFFQDAIVLTYELFTKEDSAPAVVIGVAQRKFIARSEEAD